MREVIFSFNFIQETAFHLIHVSKSRVKVRRLMLETTGNPSLRLALVVCWAKLSDSERTVRSISLSLAQHVYTVCISVSNAGAFQLRNEGFVGKNAVMGHNPPKLSVRSKKMFRSAKIVRTSSISMQSLVAIRGGRRKFGVFLSVFFCLSVCHAWSVVLHQGIKYAHYKSYTFILYWSILMQFTSFLQDKTNSLFSSVQMRN